MANIKGDISEHTYSTKFLSENLFSNGVHFSVNSDSKIPTGFRDIDEMIEGFNYGDLICLGARPAMGKTAFIFSMALQMDQLNAIPILIFSMQFDSETAIKRLVCADAEVSNNFFMEPVLCLNKREKLRISYNRFNRSRILIDDEKFLKTEDLVERATYYNVRFGTEVIYIDGLEMLISKIQNKNEVNEVLLKLKKLAKALNCVVIVTFGLPISLEKRDKKIPNLSDIENLGDFHRIADIIGFIYRPEYYGFLQGKHGKSNQGKAILKLDKIKTDWQLKITLQFIGEWAKFKDWE